jgi:hypothetical protein
MLAEVAARLCRGQQLASLRDQAFGVGRDYGLFVFGIQGFVDQDHELGKLMQPPKPRVVKNKVEQLPARSDARDVAIIRCGFGVEKGLMQP